MNLWARLELRVAARLLRSARQRCREKAFGEALLAFEGSCPHWTDVLFDRPFLSGPRAAAALRARDPEALARAWAAQFTYADEVQRLRDVRRLLPAAETFLALLRRAEGPCAHEMAAWLSDAAPSPEAATT